MLGRMGDFTRAEQIFVSGPEDWRRLVLLSVSGGSREPVGAATGSKFREYESDWGRVGCMYSFWRKNMIYQRGRKVHGSFMGEGYWFWYAGCCVTR